MRAQKEVRRMEDKGAAILENTCVVMSRSLHEQKCEP